MAVFLGGIQGCLMNMLPIEFMDGLKVWRWSKLAWFAATLPLAFIFFEVILKQGSNLQSASGDNGVKALFLVCIVFWGVTAGTWAFFKLRKLRPGRAGS